MMVSTATRTQNTLPAGLPPIISDEMIVDNAVCPRCGRLVEVVNPSGAKGARGLDFLKKHDTDFHGGVVCPGSETYTM